MNPAPPVTRIRASGARRGSWPPAPPDVAWSVTASADRPLDRSRELAGLVVVAGELGGPDQRGHRAGVGPVAVVDPVVQATVGDVVVEDVGDLELAASGRGERVDDRERVGPEEVDAD